MTDKLKPSERKHLVSELYFKGYSNSEIADMAGLSPKQVSEDIKYIKHQLLPKTIRQIEYYRNKSRKRLDMIRKRAWEISEDKDFRAGARVSALRLVKEVEELQSKVDGIVTEKMPAGPDKKAEELGKKLVQIAAGKDKGNGHDEEEDDLVSDAITNGISEEADT